MYKHYLFVRITLGLINKQNDLNFLKFTTKQLIINIKLWLDVW